MIETFYSFRNFCHIIKAYNYNNVWQEVGTSLSRYYYKHTYVFAYNKDVGDFESWAYDFTHTNGYSPEYIAKASNYMNYEVLLRYGNECYWTNKYYRESY